MGVGGGSVQGHRVGVTHHSHYSAYFSKYPFVIKIFRKNPRLSCKVDTRTTLDADLNLWHPCRMLTSEQEHTSVVSVATLGFGSGGKDVPAIIKTDDLPPLNETTDADLLAEVIRQKSLARVNELSDLLAERAADPTASSKLLLDTIEQNIKLSGITAKQQARELAAAGGYQLIINIGTATETHKGVTIDATPEPTTLPPPDAGL